MIYDFIFYENKIKYLTIVLLLVNLSLFTSQILSLIGFGINSGI